MKVSHPAATIQDTLLLHALQQYAYWGEATVWRSWTPNSLGSCCSVLLSKVFAVDCVVFKMPSRQGRLITAVVSDHQRRPSISCLLLFRQLLDEIIAAGRINRSGDAGEIDRRLVDNILDLLAGFVSTVNVIDVALSQHFLVWRFSFRNFRSVDPDHFAAYLPT